MGNQLLQPGFGCNFGLDRLYLLRKRARDGKALPRVFPSRQAVSSRILKTSLLFDGKIIPQQL
jgi:hypothetical protein